MPQHPASGQTFNILAVLQGGRLQYEAVLLAASLRHTNPGFAGKLYLAEPQPGPRWSNDPRLTDSATRALLESLGAEIIPFENKVFGESYPYGNKIEALAALPDAPFLFLDTDTLITGSFDQVSFDFSKPSASMRREGTWPQIELYGPGYGAIWKSLYDRFGLDYESSLDRSQPDEYWQRYLYFNAGWFFHESPRAFGARFLDYARESDLAVQVLETVCAPQAIKKILKESEPFKRLVYQPKGQKARSLFDRADLPKREQVIRNTLKRENCWFR